MKQLQADSSLPAIQAYVKQVLSERGFDEETLPEKIMLLTEELGELARAVRKHSQVKMSGSTKQADAAAEAADVFMLLVDICNTLEIDLYQALEAKEAVNAQRSWQ